MFIPTFQILLLPSGSLTPSARLATLGPGASGFSLDLQIQTRNTHFQSDTPDPLLLSTVLFDIQLFFLFSTSSLSALKGAFK